MISSVSRLLSSSLLGIPPDHCARCSDPCALGSSVFPDRSPGSIISRVSRLLSSSLLGIRPEYCVLYSVPFALWSSIFLDQSPRSMVRSILHLLSSSLFGIRPGARVRFSVPCVLESSIFLVRSRSAIVSVPQSFAGSNSFSSPSLRASSGISRASFFCYLQITCTGQGNMLCITGPYL